MEEETRKQANMKNSGTRNPQHKEQTNPKFLKTKLLLLLLFLSEVWVFTKKQERYKKPRTPLQGSKKAKRTWKQVRGRMI